MLGRVCNAPVLRALDVHKNMTPKKKVSLAIICAIALLIGVLQLIVSSVFSGGPSPKQVLVVSSENFDIKSILDAIDSISPKLDSKLNKKQHPASFPMYEQAYWYPFNSSHVYGVSVIEWNSSYLPKDESDRKGKYFIDIYSNSRTCHICNLVGQALLRKEVSFSLLCNKQQVLTEYAKTRCDI